jgi:hypothetical protein
MLSAYLWAVAGRGWREPGMWLALVAPATLIAIVFGQTGLLAAALMAGGFRAMGRRPFLGGLILAGLAFKPQLFFLVPIVLLAARQWRALAGLVVGGVGLVALSAAAFGPAIWLRWIEAAPRLWQIYEENRPALSHYQPTLSASLLSAGVGKAAAMALQAVLALGVVVCLWMLFRRGAPGAAPRPLDVAALQVGVFLATPYAFVYDLPMVTAAVALMIETQRQSGRSWRSGEVAVLVAALLLPIALINTSFEGWPLGPVILLLLFGTIVRAGWNAHPAR